MANGSITIVRKSAGAARGFLRHVVGDSTVKDEESLLDALIVFKAVRTAREAGDPLHGVYTFVKAMQQLPHTESLRA